MPLWALRTDRWKYIETETGEAAPFVELYDLVKDPLETKNLAGEAALEPILRGLGNRLADARVAVMMAK